MTNICQKFFTFYTDQETKNITFYVKKNANKKKKKKTNTKNTLIIDK